MNAINKASGDPDLLQPPADPISSRSDIIFVPHVTITAPTGAIAHAGLAAPIQGVSVSDFDAAATVTVTATSTVGDLTLDGDAGLGTLYTINDGTLTVSGTLSAVNALLADLTDTVTGPDDITLNATDSDNSIAFSQQITVAALPLPVIIAPTTVSGSAGQPSPIPDVSISEPGATSGETFDVTLTAAAGQLRLSGLAGPDLSITNGTVSVSGTLAYVNAVLASLTDTSAGTDSITITATDSIGGTATPDQISELISSSAGTIDTPSPIVLPDAHVTTGGAPSDTVPLTIANIGTSGQGLSAFVSGVTGDGYGTGAIFGLPPGQTDSTDIVVGLNDLAAGAEQGAVTIGFNLGGAGSGANIVQNGGFENGTLDWITGNQVQAGSPDDIEAHSGSYYLSLANVGSDAFTSQTLATETGAEYAISLWYYASGQYPDDLNVLFGGTNVLSLSDPAAAGWTEYTEYATATSDTTVLSIGGRNDPAEDGVDDVSVVPITDFGTVLPSETVTVQGNVYRLAAPSIASLTGLYVHAGDGGGNATVALSITNAAAADGFSENLDASVTGLSAGGGYGASIETLASEANGSFSSGGASAGGSFLGLAPGATDATDLTVTIPTAATGSINGTVTIDAVSDGNGVDSLGTTDLGPRYIPFSVTVNNYATAQIQETSLNNVFGGGVLTQVGNTYTLDLGLIAESTGDILAGLNLADTAAAPADLIDAVVTQTGDPAFIDTLLNNGTVAVGASQSLTFDTIDIGAGGTGVVSETLTVQETDTNPGGFSQAMPTQTVVVVGTVVSRYAARQPGDQQRFDGRSAGGSRRRDRPDRAQHHQRHDGGRDPGGERRPAHRLGHRQRIYRRPGARRHRRQQHPGRAQYIPGRTAHRHGSDAVRHHRLLHVQCRHQYRAERRVRGRHRVLVQRKRRGGQRLRRHPRPYRLRVSRPGRGWRRRPHRPDPEHAGRRRISGQFLVPGVGRYPSDLHVSFGGDLLVSLTDAPPAAWTEYTEDVVATSNISVLDIAGRNDPSWDGIDDVSVVAIGTSSLGSIVMPPQTVTVTGAVYQEASPYVTGPYNVYLHVGDGGGRVQEPLTITNEAAANGYSENLNAGVVGYTSGVITATGTVSELAPGTSDNTSLTETVFTTQPGYFGNYISVHAISDGTGVDNLGTTDLGTLEFPVYADILNYATAAIVQLGSVGTLTGGGHDYTLNLDDISLNSGTVVATLGVANLASIAADYLEGTVTASGDPEYSLSGNTYFSYIGAGGTQSGLNIAIDASTAGVFTETVTLSPTDFNEGGFSEVLANETVTVTGTVEVFSASPRVNTPSPVSFGAVRAGTPLSQALSISNVAPDGAGSLDVTASASGEATVTGSIVALAPGAADTTDITAGLADIGSGVDQGTVTLSYLSQNAGGTIEAITPSSAQVILDATVYSEAQHAIGLGALPVFHTGDGGGSESGSFSISNDAYSGYTEALIASVTDPTGIIAVTPTVTPDIGAFGSTSIPYTIPTNQAGTVTGTVTVDFATDGTGTDGAAVTQIGSQVVTVAAVVFNYATAEVDAVSGPGILTDNDGVYTLDLGSIAQGDLQVLEDLALTNAALPASDLLSGNVTASGDPNIGFGGPYYFSGIGAQQSVNGIDLSLNSSATGVFHSTVTIQTVDLNPGGYIAPAQTLTVDVTGTVTPQTGFEAFEPGPTVLHVGDLGAGQIGLLDTFDVASGESLVTTVLNTPGGVTLTPPGPIAPGATGELDYTINTANPGTVYGAVGLAFAGETAGSSTALGTLDVPIVASIYNYATAAVLASGFNLTSNGTATVINLGTLEQGAPEAVADLAILNAANGLADNLSGALTPLTNTGLVVSDSGAFSGLRGGYADYVQTVGIIPDTPGTIDATFALSATGSDPGGYSGALAGQTVTVVATVLQAQPPTITASSAITVLQGAAGGVAASVDDPSAFPGETFTVNATDTTGLLSASGTGVTITGSGSTHLTIVGSLDNVNTALATLADTDTSTSDDQITLTAADAFANTSTATVAVSVAPSSPRFHGPTLLTVQLGGASGPLGLSIDDPDLFGTTPITVTIAAQGGTVSDAVIPNGATITSEDSDHTLVITDLPANIDNDLGNVDYQPPGGDPPTSDQIGVSASSSSGISLSGSISVTINPPAPPPPPSGPPMSSALFAAILAMDLYNRGYSPGVGGLPDFAASAPRRSCKTTTTTRATASMPSPTRGTARR